MSETLFVANPFEQLRTEGRYVLEGCPIKNIKRIFLNVHGGSISRFGIMVNYILYWDT